MNIRIRLRMLSAFIAAIVPTAIALAGTQDRSMTGGAPTDPTGNLDESPYMKKVDEADKACNEGDWRKAEQALTEAMSLEPSNHNNVLLLSNLGIIRYNMGLDSLAIATLTDAHRMAPSSVTILSNRARILLANGYEDEAYSDLDLILQLDSMVITPRFHHCLLSLRRHDFRMAKKDFEFMRKHFPEDIETDIAGASVLSGTGDYTDAIPLYSKIIEQRKDAEYYSGRAYCYLLTDQLQEASDDINTALSLTPDDGELYLYRSALNKRRFRPDDAEADAMRAVELGVDRERVKQFLNKGK